MSYEYFIKLLRIIICCMILNVESIINWLNLFLYKHVYLLYNQLNYIILCSKVSNPFRRIIIRINYYFF